MEEISSIFSTGINYIRYIRIADIVDILLVAYLIYKAIWFVRKTNSYNLAKGIMVILLALLASYVFDLRMIYFLLSHAVEIGLLALVVLFQPELRRLLERMGRSFSATRTASTPELETAIAETVQACVDMAASRTGVQVMDNPGEAKYGMTEDQMAEAFIQLKKDGAKHFGIHAFLASNTVSNDYYAELSAILFGLAVRLSKRCGVHIAFINLSGGVGVDYRPEEPRADIAEIGELVRQKYEEILTPEGMDDVAIFAELGRYMMAPYGALVAKCLHTKHIYKDYIGLDACAANLMRPAMYGSYHHITVLGKENAPCDHKYDVTGGLCENNDKFAIDRMLPEILPDDIVYIHDTGAHGFSMGYNYNGKLRSAEVLLKEDGSHQLIRRAESMDDYFATFDFSPYKFDTK